MNIRLSSFKRDHGLKELLSPDTLEFWHTDDNLPHFIKLSFSRRKYIDHIQLYLSYLKDDSYTPEKIDLFAGETTDSMRLVVSLTLKEPEGVVQLMLRRWVIYAYVVVGGNHQEGRDSHVRHLKVISADNEEILPRFY